MSDTATITATNPIKVGLSGVPINHMASRLSALLTKRYARLADLGSDLDQAIVALRRTAHRAPPLCTNSREIKPGMQNGEYIHTARSRGPGTNPRARRTRKTILRTVTVNGERQCDASP